MIKTALTFVLGASAAGWILSQLKMIAIFTAVLAVSTVGAGVYGYIKGHNNAATACKLNSVTRQLNEARRDNKIGQDTGKDLSTELAASERRMEEANRRVQEYADQLSKEQSARSEAERKLAEQRPKGCPDCPKPDPCVVR